MKTLLVGFFGEGNLGDEAILEGFLRAARNPNGFLVTAGNSKIPPGVEKIYRKGLVGWIEFLKALSCTREVIFMGGILQDWSIEGVTFFALRMFAGKFFKKRISLWGAGLGPLRNETLRRISRSALLKTDTVWLRDGYSVDLFGKLTAKIAHRGTDWSWMIPQTSQWRRTVNEKWGTAINLRPWRDLKWFETVSERLKNNLYKSPVTGFALRKEDQKILSRLTLSKLKGPSSFDLFSNLPRKPESSSVCDTSTEFFEPASFSELMEFCNTVAEAWTMRYHALIAAIRSGVPVVPLSYDKKVESLAMEAGLHSAVANPSIASPVRVDSQFIQESKRRLDNMKAALEEYLGH
ncbi:MAG: polysaccharide pyruvyl transferase family protein [Candidatus Riflebacteria bacterium]|nr:polysaccharide pyruvyl transferase family protein [Candidatus Riflebacteria bacterium]